ncbi:MAG TPA: acyloxyacyl hydrolase [Terracidiphilus sp.]
MQTYVPGVLFRRAAAWSALLLAYCYLASALHAQTGRESRYYSRTNSFGFFIAYSNDSSHMLLGDAEQRKLLEFGASYSRRLLIGREVNWQYSAEFLPIAVESDPLTRVVISQTSPSKETIVMDGKSPFVTCHPPAYAFSVVDGDTTYAGTETLSCRGRRWTMGEAMSPIGMQWNFRPAYKLQPFLNWHGGFMYSTKEIPVDSAGSFNFTFGIGAGLELYRTRTRSFRLEYRYHHISNDETATSNPGIDNSLFQVTYTFGH